MNFYYCTSEWEHAVIEADSSTIAKEKFVDIINRNLEDSKKLSSGDVSAFVVNVYFYVNE